MWTFASYCKVVMGLYGIIQYLGDPYLYAIIRSHPARDWLRRPTTIIVRGYYLNKFIHLYIY